MKILGYNWKIPAIGLSFIVGYTLSKKTCRNIWKHLQKRDQSMAALNYPSNHE